MAKELEGLKEGPKVKIHLNSLRTTLKKVPNWKMPGFKCKHGYWLKNFHSIHDRQAIKMNRCLLETNIPEWMTK